MPEQTYPPYVSGALTVPRQLNRWLDINPQNGFLSRTSTVITLPAFTTSNTWSSPSKIVAAFNFESPNNFSLKPFTPPTSPNFALVISYRIGTTVTRYLLWDATGSALFDITPYDGQPILKNCRFEVWDTSQGAASQATDFTFYTSKTGTVDYRWGDDVTLVANDGLVLAFIGSSTPNGTSYTFSYPITFPAGSYSTTN